MKLRAKHGRKTKRVASRNGAAKTPKLRPQTRHGEIVRVIDNKGRIVLPDARPGQPMAIVCNSDGSLTVTPLKAATREPFPPGSLAYLCTPERDAEMTDIAAATIIGVPKDYDTE